MAKDLYGTLGINKNANEAELKKAYRNLARKYHPDVNKASDAEAKFKEVQHAYEILSDPQKKANYDQFGIDDNSASGGAGGYSGSGGFEGFSGFSGFGGFNGFDGLDDVFESFFGGQGRSAGRRSGGRRGEDLRFDLEITLEEAAFGVKKEINVGHFEKCTSCKGSGAEPGSSKTTCSYCKGQGQVKNVQRTILGSFSQITACPQCHGAGEIVKTPCSKCRGKGINKVQKIIQIDIPAGVDSNTKLRVSGEGNAGEGNGPAGDLYVFIFIKKHKYFVRAENDVHVEIEIPLTKAILGTEVEVPTLDGSAILRVPPGTQSGTIFRFRGKGITNIRGYSKGDQHILVKVKIPTSLSGKEKELIEQLSSLRQENKPAKNFLDYVRKFF